MRYSYYCPHCSSYTHVSKKLKLKKDNDLVNSAKEKKNKLKVLEATYNDLRKAALEEFEDFDDRSLIDKLMGIPSSSDSFGFEYYLWKHCKDVWDMKWEIERMKIGISCSDSQEVNYFICKICGKKVYIK